MTLDGLVPGPEIRRGEVAVVGHVDVQAGTVVGIEDAPVGGAGRTGR